MPDTPSDLESNFANQSQADFASRCFDGTLATGQYIFTVMLVGLLGGMFGSFVDFVLAFVSPEWAGAGRHGGWLLFACLAAFGVPIGWFRPEGSPFSIASPTKQRRRLAELRSGENSRKRKPLKEEFQIRRPRHIAGATAVWGCSEPSWDWHSASAWQCAGSRFLLAHSPLQAGLSPFPSRQIRTACPCPNTNEAART
jgi:hypothetical protein